MKKQYEGVTLIEVLLVLAIGAAILVLSLRQYESFRADADVQQLEYNVNNIFSAMSQFYKANCYGTTNPSTIPPNPAIQGGKLNPVISPTSPVAISINNDLIKNGFLSSLPPLSPIVDSSAGSGTNGYVTQFNEYTSPRNVCTSTNCATSSSTGTIVIWKSQVAVSLKDTATAQQYLNLLNGDCLSSATGSTVTPCTPGSTGTGNYVVWERLPSFSASQSNSETWMLNPIVNQFTSLYNNYSNVYTLTSGGKIPVNQTQYFLCGG